MHFRQLRILILNLLFNLIWNTNITSLIKYNWRPPSLSELTTVISYKELAHFGSEALN